MVYSVKSDGFFCIDIKVLMFMNILSISISFLESYRYLVSYQTVSFTTEILEFILKFVGMQKLSIKKYEIRFYFLDIIGNHLVIFQRTRQQGPMSIIYSSCPYVKRKFSSKQKRFKRIRPISKVLFHRIEWYGNIIVLSTCSFAGDYLQRSQTEKNG